MPFSILQATRYHDDLEEIGRKIKDPRDRSRVDIKDLPRRVGDMARLLRKIEDVVLTPDALRGMWGTDRIPRQIKSVLVSRDDLNSLVDHVRTELGRTTGRAMKNDDILPELLALISLLQIIQGAVQSQVQEKMSWTDLGVYVRNRLGDVGRDISLNREILRKLSQRIDPTAPDTSNFQDLPETLDSYIHKITSDNSYETRSNKEILKSISRIIDPTNSEESLFVELPTKVERYGRQISDESQVKNKSNREILKRISYIIDPTNSDPSNFESLINKVGSLVEESASRQDSVQDDPSPDPERGEDTDAIAVGKKLKGYTDRVDALREKEEQMSNELKDTQEKLTQALGEVGLLRNIIKARDLEAEQKTMVELGLVNRQQSLEAEIEEAKQSCQTLEGKLEDAKQRCQTISEAKEIEIQVLQTTAKNLRELHAVALKKAGADKDTSISELEEAHSEQIRTLRIQHAKQLETQKTAIARQHEEEMIAERKKHASDHQHAESIKKNAIAELEDAHNEHIRTLTDQHAKKLESQKTAIARQHEGEMIAERKKHGAEKHRIETQFRGLHDDALRKQKEAENARASIAKELHEQETSLSEARKEIESQDVKLREHQQSLSEAEEQIEAQKSRCITLKKRHSERLAEQKVSHSIALSKAESEKREELEILRQEHNRQKSQNETKWEAEKFELKGALQLERVRSKETIEEEAQKHKVSIEQLEAELLGEKTRTAEKVEAEAQKYKSTIEKLELGRKKLLSMLLKQEDYPGLSDQEIVRGVSSKTGKVAIVGFGSMVSQVTTFSEWEWREDRKIWSKDTMTALVGTKQRRLKKLILGDAIWTTLYQWVFCSPFRVLGKEGERLEADWNKLFPSYDNAASDEYRWPLPDELSEKYRYDTCEAALDSLTKPSSPYNALRHSFAKHQPQMQKRFLQIIDAFVDLTEKRKRELLGFLTEAIQMWLVLCTHRCRLRMIPLGSKELDPVKKSVLAQERDDLKFTVTPRLQRHGNAKGEQLEAVSVVSGCDGAVATVTES